MKNSIYRSIENQVHDIYNNIGINTPSNHDDIMSFIYDEIVETADIDWHYGDVAIAFRRWIEEQSNSNHL